MTGAADADALAYDREPAEYRHARLLDHGRGDWAMTIARRYLYETSDAVRLEALVGASWAPLAELVGKLVREERYHLMHVGPWLERLATTSGEPRDRLLAALETLGPDAGTVFTPFPGEAALIDGRDPRRADGGARAAWRARSRADLRTPRPAVPPPTRDPARGRTDHGAAFAWLRRRVHRGPPQRPGSDLVSEAATHVGIARARTAGSVAARRRPRSTDVHAALAEVPDPELPVLSIVDLGIVHRVERRCATGSASRSCRLRRLPGAGCHPRLDRRPARGVRPPGRGR